MIHIRDVQCCREVSERYPEIAYEEVIIDNCCMMVSYAARLSPDFGPHPGWRCCHPSSLARTHRGGAGDCYLRGKRRSPLSVMFSTCISRGALSEGRRPLMALKVYHVWCATEESDESLADSYTKSLLLA
jgi:hypothetical protein